MNENKKIEKLKSKRENLYRKLNALHREVERAISDKRNYDTKINKGVELSKEFQMITYNLIQLGCKFNSKSPYLFREYWENIQSSIQETNQEENITTLDTPPDQEAVAIPCDTPCGEQLSVNSIKNALKEVINELNLGCKTETYNYIINVAGIGDKNIGILTQYLNGMGAGLQYSDVDEDRGEQLKKFSIVCSDEEYKYIIKSTKTIIDVLNMEYVEIFGKKCI